MAVDSTRWTGNEREVITAGLTHYRLALRARERRTSSPIVKADCQWRLVAIQQALEMIRDR